MAEIPPLAPPYEPPRIEQVFTPDDLEREVMYAATDGAISVDLPGT